VRIPAAVCIVVAWRGVEWRGAYVEVAPPGLVAHVEVAAVGDVLPHALDELGLVAVGHGVEGQEQLARPIVGGGGGRAC
jgi:hypothetical protein